MGMECVYFVYIMASQKNGTLYVGVMAQEVQEIDPKAVWRDRDGFLRVDYGRIGVKFMTWDEWVRQTAAKGDRQ